MQQYCCMNVYHDIVDNVYHDIRYLTIGYDKFVYDYFADNRQKSILGFTSLSCKHTLLQQQRLHIDIGITT